MGTAKDIRVAVEAELRFDPMVDAAGITVNNIGGNVALNGTVPSYPQYLEAAAANTTLAGNSTLPNTVQATARGGNLTLAGAVRNGAQRAAAEQAVTGLTGIRNVRDQIEVISGDPFSDVTVLVQDAIDRYAVLFDKQQGDSRHQRARSYAHRARAHLGGTRRRGRRRLDGPRHLQRP